MAKDQYDLSPECMDPVAEGIWELRTHDLRLFAWFCENGSVIISAIDTKARCVEFALYRAYQEQAIRDRNKLDLDEPKFIPGDDPTNVF